MNEYFDPQVTSIGFQTSTLTAFVGVMANGEYESGMRQIEVMTVVSGLLTIKLPASDEWQDFCAGELFSVDAD